METIQRAKSQANFMKVGCAQGLARIWLDKMEVLGMRLA